METNKILSITVDDTIKHGMRAKKCASAYTKNVWKWKN